MEFGDCTAGDLPAPATLSEDAAGFPVPVYGLVAQPHLQFASHGATAINGMTESISINYSYLAVPEEPDADAMFVVNVGEVRGWMQKADIDQQPDWFKQGLAASRYPTLWEAVLTAIDPSGDRTLAEHLADHVNHLLVNTIDYRRTFDGDHIPRVDHAVRPSHAQPATITVAGEHRAGLVIDTDPDIIGWAVQVEDAIVILGLPRDRAARLLLELAPIGSTHRE